MEHGEEAIQRLEAHLPERFAAAVTQACWATLAEGHTVLQDADAEVFSRLVPTSNLLRAAGLLGEASSLRAEGHVLDCTAHCLN